jgi:hypothetical protein
MNFLIFPLLCAFTLASVASDAIVAGPTPNSNPLSFTFASRTTTARWASAEVFENSVHSIYDSIGLGKYDMSYDAFRHALVGYYNLVADQKIKDTGLLTVIDFTKASTERRFYTVDLHTKKVVFYSYVSHGKNTGENFAKSFSNRAHSNQSSLGFYVTAETYVGSKGYSLKLDGMDKGFNDNIRARAVVMHEADYVSESWINRYGRLGRSQGCPALPKELNRKVIDTIKGGTLIFAYYNDDNFITSSAHLNLDKLLEHSVAPSAL